MTDLKRLEVAMRDTSPIEDAWWKLRTKRNALRDATTGYVPRRDKSLIETWPKTGTEARWRILRAHIEEWHGVRTGDVGRTSRRLARIRRGRGKLGRSLCEWIVLVDDLDGNGWEYILRDAISLEPVAGTERFSLLVSGEGDYHWTIALAEMAKDDPRVVGYWLDEETNRWRADSGKRDAPYGTFPHITDFVRSMLLTYVDALLPHPRLRSADAPRTTALPTSTPVVDAAARRLLHEVVEPALRDVPGSKKRMPAASHRLSVDFSLDETPCTLMDVLKLVADPLWQTFVRVIRTSNRARSLCSLDFKADGHVEIKIQIDGTMSTALTRDARDVRLRLTREETAKAVGRFMLDGAHHTELEWISRSFGGSAD